MAKTHTDDPTDLNCIVCGTGYHLNDAHVAKALTLRTEEELERAKLCWVCLRLKLSVEKEAGEDKCPAGDC